MTPLDDLARRFTEEDYAINGELTPIWCNLIYYFALIVRAYLSYKIVIIARTPLLPRPRRWKFAAERTVLDTVTTLISRSREIETAQLLFLFLSRMLREREREGGGGREEQRGAVSASTI